MPRRPTAANASSRWAPRLLPLQTARDLMTVLRGSRAPRTRPFRTSKCESASICSRRPDDRRRAGATVDSVNRANRVRRHHPIPALARTRAWVAVRRVRRALGLVGGGARGGLGIDLGLLRRDRAWPLRARARAPRHA